MPGFRRSDHYSKTGWAREEPVSPSTVWQNCWSAAMIRRCSTACIRASKVSSVSSGAIGTTSWTITSTGVDLGDDMVDHTAALGDLAAPIGLEGALDRVQAGERAGLRRVQVQHAPWEMVQERRRKDMQPAGQHDQVGLVGAQLERQRLVVGRARLARVEVGLEREIQGGDAGLLGARQAERGPAVRHHQGHLGRVAGQRRSYRGWPGGCCPSPRYRRSVVLAFLFEPLRMLSTTECTRWPLQSEF